MKIIIILSMCLTLAASVSFRSRQTNDSNATFSERVAVPVSQNASAEIAALITAPTQAARIAILDQDSDYVFDFLDPSAGEIKGDGGKLVVADRSNFPGVVGNGVSMLVASIEACGIVPPHTHPRATENFYVINGTFTTGFIGESGDRQVQNTLYAGQAGILPQGSMHWQANLGCEEATFVASFNSEDPGTLLIAPAFFSINSTILNPTLGNVTDDQVESIAAGLPAAIIEGISACRVRCGLQE